MRSVSQSLRSPMFGNWNEQKTLLLWGRIEDVEAEIAVEFVRR
jgi:hypothetical protein